MKSPSGERIEELRAHLSGNIVLPGDTNYDEVREIWNAMISRRPAVIVQCASADDVPLAIAFARSNDLEISIRGAGHNIAGNAICNDGLMIDLSGMTKVDVDTGARIARIEPGATLGNIDEATQAHGLALPVGINSTTGIAGLTLGGGFGWLTRKYGMTIDNLLSADLVTAEGEKLHLSEGENSDLFWAIRGGGGNFGVITQFEFSLHPVGPEVLAGLLVFPIAEAKEVMSQFREFVKTTPEELSVWVVLRKAPPLPFLPEEVHGKEVVVLALCHCGDVKEGEKLIEPLYGFGTAYGTHVGVMPFAGWQQAFDPLLTPGARNYWKSHNFTELSDGLFDTIIEYVGTLPSPQCEIFFAHIAGKANRIASDATAYTHRDAQFVLNVHGRWDSPEEDQKCIDWSRAFFDASLPYASAGVYINFMTEEEGDRIAAAFGSNYERLAQVKKQYDPGNVFHLNQNIKT